MIKLVNLLKENDNDWRVKDIIAMQKAHERVLRATSTLEKAIKNLEKVSKNNSNKRNGTIWVKEAHTMMLNFISNITNTNSQFWKAWEEYRKGGRAAFPKHWD